MSNNEQLYKFVLKLDNTVFYDIKRDKLVSGYEKRATLYNMDEIAKFSSIRGRGWYNRVGLKRVNAKTSVR